LFRNRHLRDPAGVATLSQKIAAERRIRTLLQNEGLPQPDEVEYGHTCIRLFWHDAKQVVVIQIDEPPPGFVYAEDMSDEERERLAGDATGREEDEMPFQRFQPGRN
jgi:hypothetical protein